MYIVYVYVCTYVHIVLVRPREETTDGRDRGQDEDGVRFDLRRASKSRIEQLGRTRCMDAGWRSTDGEPCRAQR